MRVIYTGGPGEFPPQQKKKLDQKAAKVAKLLPRSEDKEAHVVLTAERHLHRAEITVNHYDHPMVGIESSSDVFTALCGAFDKLEKQVLKARNKWRDTKRGASNNTIRQNWEPEEAAAPVDGVEVPTGRVFRVNHHQNRKPMTVDEALLAMEDGKDYLVYRDAETDRVAVLLRRRDGNFDLVEA